MTKKATQMLPLITDADEARKYLLEHLNSGAYWTLLTAPDYAYKVTEIEERYYSGSASDDFILLMSGGEFGILGIFLAHKRRMSSTQLYDILKVDALIPTSPAQLEARDIIFLGNEREATILAAQFAAILHPNT